MSSGNDLEYANAGQEHGVLMRTIAAMLAERGFDVRGPEHEESRCLTITNAKRARCEINAFDDGSIVWEYYPWSGGGIDSTEMSGMVQRILGADKAVLAGLDTRVHVQATLKGQVARRMKACGLKADLVVYEDKEFFDAAAEVALSNPANPGRGLVRVTDDGILRWECNYGKISEREAAIADITADVLVPAARSGSGAR